MIRQFRATFGLSAALLLGGIAHAQLCNSAEPPAAACDLARVIPGTQGHHVVMMDVSTATGTSTICDGIFTGNNVWFEVTPALSGPMTITTCHPATQFDTVLQVYSGGDSNCDFMVEDTCNDDDSYGIGCTSNCGPRSSTVLVQAVAGTRYRFVVGSFGASITSPCLPCLGVRVTIGAPCGDPPNNLDATLATELPGDPGVYTAQVDVTDAIKLPSEPNPNCTGDTIGNSVWYRVTPQQDGALTVSTCTGLSNFDTVAAIYQDGGGGTLLQVGCSDDELIPECFMCPGNTYGSLATADVLAGQTYLIQVGSFGDNIWNCSAPLCLGVEMTLEGVCEADLTPPEVALLTPPELTAGCTCPGVTIDGWAYDPQGTFDEWILEYRAIGSASWNGIAGSTAEILPPGGPVALWNLGLPQGYYVLRLTAVNICSRASSTERIVWLDTGFDSVSAATAGGSIVGGQACIGGTVTDNFCFAQYQVDYRPAGGGAFQPVDPSFPTYNTGVINATLATWDTTALPDGDYELRIDGETDCGDGATVTFPVIVDNTPPTVFITSPPDCSGVSGIVPVTGIVDDSNLAGWSLSFTGGGFDEWVPINSGSAPVSNGLLANWDVSGLPPCCYTLRLTASDQAALACNGVVHNVGEFLVSVEVLDPAACPEDINGNGIVDLTDLALLLAAFDLTCP